MGQLEDLYTSVEDDRVATENTGLLQDKVDYLATRKVNKYLPINVDKARGISIMASIQALTRAATEPLRSDKAYVAATGGCKP